MEITGDHLIERGFTLSDGFDWVYELEYVRGTKLVIVLSGAGLVLVEDDGNRVISPRIVTGKPLSIK